MEREIYITDGEREKCRKIADVYAELEDVDILILDAGRYGFVKLQYYTFPCGFDDVVTFTDSQTMFDDLWKEWLHTQLIMLAKEMNIDDVDYDDVYMRLSEEKRRELLNWRDYFEKKVRE